jgi:hypothetical protein
MAFGPMCWCGRAWDRQLRPGGAAFSPKAPVLHRLYQSEHLGKNADEIRFLLR